MFLTSDRYFVRPLAADISVAGADQGWVLRSPPRESLRIEYDVVDRTSNEIVLHDRTSLSCESGVGAEGAPADATSASVAPADATSASVAPAPSPPADATPRVLVHLRGERPGVDFYRVDHADAAPATVGVRTVWLQEKFRELCTAPCDVELEPGRHRFALALDDGNPVLANPMLDVADSTTVTGGWIDRSGERTAGGVLGLTGLVLPAMGIPLAVDGLSRNNGLTEGGIGFGVIGLSVVLMVVGMVLGFHQDSAVVHFD